MERKNKKYDDITGSIYELILNEYNSLFARSRSIDSRAGIFLTLLITAFPFYIQIIDVNSIKDVVQSYAVSFVDVLYASAFFCSVVVFLISIIFLTISLCTRTFMIFKTELFDGFNIIEYEDSDTTVNDVNVSLFSVLRQLVEYNNTVVDKKGRLFSAALWISFSFVALMIGTIILMIL